MEIPPPRPELSGAFAINSMLSELGSGIFMAQLIENFARTPFRRIFEQVSYGLFENDSNKRMVFEWAALVPLGALYVVGDDENLKDYDKRVISHLCFGSMPSSFVTGPRQCRQDAVKLASSASLAAHPELIEACENVKEYYEGQLRLGGTALIGMGFTLSLIDNAWKTVRDRAIDIVVADETRDFVPESLLY